MKPISALLLFTLGTALGQAAEPAKLKLHWAKNYLTISGDHLPGGEMKIHYLEAYCRANSQTTDWSKHTVVGHKTRMISRSADGSQLKLHCVVSDGVTVEHVITATHDEVDFRLTAHNPTNKRSEAHWAQPCIRVGKFTGTGADATPDKYAYIKKSFIYLDGKRAMMPTQGWATEARYIPGLAKIKKAPKIELQPQAETQKAKKKKNFGGKGGPSGNKNKGIKNAKRQAALS